MRPLAVVIERQPRGWHRAQVALTVALLGILITACGATNVTTTTASARPAGAWGALIGCLQSHPLLSVLPAGTGAGNISASTSAVSVLQQVNGHFLAYIADMNLGSDGITGSGAANVDQIAGPAQYGFTPFASPLQRRIITGCIRSSGIAKSACAHLSLGGPKVSCAFAQAVVAAYRHARKGKPDAHGIATTHITVRKPGGGRLRMICKTASGGAVCAPNSSDAAQSVAFGS